MINFLPIEKRKPLTKLEAAKVFRDAGGKCWICDKPILNPKRWRDEHKIPLAKGGTNELSNRAPVHFECTPGKDKTDATSIAKAKRLEANRIAPGFGRPKAKIKSRGFGQGRSNTKQLHEEFE